MRVALVIWEPASETLGLLSRCQNFEFRERIAAEGHRFAAEHLDAESVYQRMRSSIMQSWGRIVSPH